MLLFIHMEIAQILGIKQIVTQTYHKIVKLMYQPMIIVDME